MSKRPLAPPLLNKLDDHLLVNRPDTWSTRIHLVLYYGFLFLLAFGTVCFFVPNDPRVRSNWELWTFATVILSTIAFIIWLVYLFRFNVFKQYGKVHIGDRLKTFLIYYFIIALIIFPSFMPRLIESFRADQEFSSQELVNDIDRMNILISEVEHDRIPTGWYSDTFQIVNDFYHQGPVMESEMPRNYKYAHIDSIQLRNRKEGGDSINRVNDSIYVVSTFFNLKFISVYSINEYSGLQTKTKLDIYNAVFKRPASINKNAAFAALEVLLDKYSNPDYHEYYYRGTDYNLTSEIQEKYHIEKVISGIDNIATRKYYLSYRHYQETILIMCYATLVLTLLVFIFRHSTVKTFFLSLLLGIILAIISGLIVAITRMRGEGFMKMILVYYALFAVVALFAFIRKHRSVINGIALNIFVFTTAFVPIICTSLYYTAVRKVHYDNGDYNFELPNEQLHYTIAHIGGIVLLLILVETLFKRLYRIWYASPEE
jgi:hypothetical protein